MSSTMAPSPRRTSIPTPPPLSRRPSSPHTSISSTPRRRSSIQQQLQHQQQPLYHSLSRTTSRISLATDLPHAQPPHRSSLSGPGPRPVGGQGSVVSLSLNGTYPPLNTNSKDHHQQSVKGDSEWAYMDPDDIFRRLNINQIKKVESLLRSNARNKQSELRSMVSERYRDLLLSTTQISGLHEGSLLLSQKLKDVKRICERPVEREKGGDEREVAADGAEEKTERNRPEDDVSQQLSIAASVKFLLDAPETLYSLLASKSFLEASFLWLLTRLVKEEIISSDKDISETSDDHDGTSPSASGARQYIPLVQRQWETLAPFRGQIVEKAMKSLRERSRSRSGKRGSDDAEAEAEAEAEHKMIAKTLMAIMLLDSHTIPDALSVFFEQRLLKLETLFRVNQRSCSAGGSARLSASRRQSASAPASAMTIGKDSRNRDSNTADETKSRQSNRLDAAQILRDLSPGPPSASAAARENEQWNPADKSTKHHLDISNTSTSTNAQPSFQDRLDHKHVLSVILASIHCLANTVEAARAIFIGSSHPTPDANVYDAAGSKGSLIRVLLDDIQSGGHSQGHGDDRKTLHGKDVEATVTAERLLHSLPSAQILINYLPSSVLNFTPYVMSSTTSTSSASTSTSASITDSSTDVSSSISNFFQSASSDLESHLSIWFKQIKNIRGLWAIRSEIKGLLRDLTNQGVLKRKESRDLFVAVDGQCRVRCKEIWERKLGEIVEAADESVRRGLGELEQGVDEGVRIEEKPSRLHFSPEIIFPTSSSTTVNVNKSSSAIQPPTISKKSSTSIELDLFRTQIQARAIERTLMVDNVIHSLESLSHALSDDIEPLRRSKHLQTTKPKSNESNKSDDGLLKSYTTATRRTGEMIVDRLEGIFKSIEPTTDASSSTEDRKAEGKDKERILLAQTFVGRVAIHLAVTSTMLDDLIVYNELPHSDGDSDTKDADASVGVGDDSKSQTLDRLIQIGQTAFSFWGTHVLSELLNCRPSEISDLNLNVNVSDVYDLSNQVRETGLPLLLSRTIGRELVSSLAVAAEEGSSEAGEGDKKQGGGGDRGRGRGWDIIKALQDPSSSSSSSRSASMNQVQKSQLLWRPLLHLSPAAATHSSLPLEPHTTPQPRGRNTLILPLGAPDMSSSSASTSTSSDSAGSGVASGSGGFDTSFSVISDIVRPCPRFGMISLV